MRRFLALSALCALLSTALFSAGWASAPDLTGSLADSFGLATLYMSGPSDLLLVKLELAAALALAPILGWVALLVHFARAGSDASARRSVVYLAVPHLAVLAGLALEVGWTRWAIAASSTEAPDDLELQLSVLELAPGGWAIKLALLIGVALWVVVFVTAKRLGQDAGPMD